MLRSCLAAEGKVGLMMNARRGDLDAILALLPALQKPTVATLSDDEWIAVHSDHRRIGGSHPDPQLKAAGARGIVEYAINKIID